MGSYNFTIALLQAHVADANDTFVSGDDVKQLVDIEKQLMCETTMEGITRLETQRRGLKLKISERQLECVIARSKHIQERAMRLSYFASLPLETRRNVFTTAMIAILNNADDVNKVRMNACIQGANEAALHGCMQNGYINNQKLYDHVKDMCEQMALIYKYEFAQSMTALYDETMETSCISSTWISMWYPPYQHKMKLQSETYFLHNQGEIHSVYYTVALYYKNSQSNHIDYDCLVAVLRSLTLPMELAVGKYDISIISVVSVILFGRVFHWLMAEQSLVAYTIFQSLSNILKS